MTVVRDKPLFLSADVGFEHLVRDGVRRHREEATGGQVAATTPRLANAA